MGSPETEEGHKSREALHKVRISEGFWLGETACTQALWLAIMGENPSRFKGDDLPVERVSWEYTKEFITQMNSLAENLQFRLPTEAEWEYACRAGTETPFSFGETIDSRQVNFNGNHPYKDSKLSEYRKKTVAVKSLPCNEWGLFEMHGDVWEWCEDWYGDYEIPNPDIVTVDPRGSDTGSLRVLRGGSWSNDAWHCRSACRISSAPEYHGDYAGFRLVSGHQFTE